MTFLPQMQAVTLDQPHAWGFCRGRRVENRNWPPDLKHGEPVAIHAGVTPRSLVELWDADVGMWSWPTGHQMPPPPESFVRFLDTKGRMVIDPAAHVEAGGDPAASLGAVVAVATFDACYTQLPPTSSQADWRSSDRFGWLFSRCDPLAIPVPWPGKRKLWRLPDHVHQRVEEQWARAMM